MHFFCDFDGTIVDSKYRIYSLFNELIGGNCIALQEYIDLKRNKISNKEILKKKFHFSSEQIEYFEKEWFNRIEQEDSLKLDILFEFSVTALETLYKMGDISLVTNRQFKDKLIKEIDRLKIKVFFKDIFVTKQNSSKDVMIKKNIIKGDKTNSYIIGDSGEDIVSGKKLGILTVGVLSGVMNQQNLELYRPDFIFYNIMEFSKYIVK